VPQEVPTLTSDQRERISSVLSIWAEFHPRPALPLIQLADGSELTPRDLAEAAQEPASERGSMIYRVFACGLIPTQLDEPQDLESILAAFERDVDEWRGAVVG
jgi:hypothetical protein